MSHYQLRAYREGDELKVLNLFSTVFGAARSLAHWQWKFGRNPYGPVVASLAWANEEDVVGHYTVMPLPLNFAGTKLLACQSVDTMVHPQHQGQGLFTATARDCYRQCAEHGVALVIGFPNRNSYPGFMRSFDWVRVAALDEYYLRLSVAAGVRRVLRFGPLARACGWMLGVSFAAKLKCKLFVQRRLSPLRATWHTSRTVPAGADIFWRQIKDYEVLSVWKDATYLRWRYDDHPDHQFSYFTLQDGDRILALAVATVADQTAQVAELMAVDHNAELGRRLMLETAAHYRRIGVARVRFIGVDDGFFAAALRDFHVMQRRDLVFCLHVFQGERLEKRAPLVSNWSISRGDLDDL